jgi:hypothetical protein
MFHVLQMYVTSVLIWMLHKFHTCVATYVQNVSIVLVFCCSKCFHVVNCVLSGCCIYFTYMLQVYVLNVSFVSYICCILVFHVARASCYFWRVRGAGSDGGTTRAPGNGTRQARSRRTRNAGRQCVGSPGRLRRHRGGVNSM